MNTEQEKEKDAIFEQIQVTSHLRFNRLLTPEGKLKGDDILFFKNAITDLCSLNEEVSEYLSKMYNLNNNHSIKNNIILCHGLSFVSQKFWCLYMMVQNRWKNKFLKEEVNCDKVKQWMSDLSQEISSSDGSVLRRRYVLSCFKNNDYTLFGYQHNDGYLLVDLRSRSKDPLCVVAFKKFELEEKGRIYWLMYCCHSQFLCIVKDHEIGLFLYQVRCKSKL